MKIVIACPIRLSQHQDIGEQVGRVLAHNHVEDYIKSLRNEGHEVFSYWDTKMEVCPTGADILEAHLQAVRACDELHVFWSEKSRGVHWEVGTAVALGKKIIIVGLLGRLEPGQSYLKALCQRPEVEWRVPEIQRPGR